MYKLNSKTTNTLQRWLKYYSVTRKRKCLLSKLVEIGKLETPKTDRYESGQLFIHKQFGYRGLIVLQWTGQVYDRDVHENPDDTNYEMVFIGGREVKYYTRNYYQVFIDSRDRPYMRIYNEESTAGTLISNSCRRLLYYTHGFDYVAHEDILPYTATEPIPVKHEMLGEFFTYQPRNNICLKPKETLKICQVKNSAVMKIDIHKETTENVRVIAIPSYIGCQKVEGAKLYSWRYLIRLHNLTGSSIRLISQSWKIYSLIGTVENINGQGIMGEEITMDSSLPAFQYSSHINLPTPFGHMIGNIKMEKEDFSKFSCRVPDILLESQSGLEEMVF